MSAPRRARILGLLYREGDLALETGHLGRVCVDVVGVTGAGVMLMSDALPIGSIATTDDVSALLEDLQFALGEGPCVDAYRDDRPVSEPDLATPKVTRWPAFAPPALEAGARAIYGFPMNVGVVRVGALNLYCDQPRALTTDQHADALVMADVAAESLLLMQAEAPRGEVAVEIDRGGNFQHVVHQASGMVAAQLEVGVAVALLRLRAHAFDYDRSLTDIAKDVVARRLRFTDDLS